ncbi:hypothetical protein D9757_000779 [Collybiopsis confluens]|uniref:DNA ligase n=1 Tax=Collybiopsis confluens TaxID=2823264 RepID=A0A8H5MGR0_9AGAR|nr:hypothetical protein D9757_000779 [Collybiopsis confluens]
MSSLKRPPNLKRRKTSTSEAQSNLHSFFSSPRKYTPTSLTKSIAKKPEIIDVDALDDDDDSPGSSSISNPISEEPQPASVLHPAKYIQTIGSVESTAPQVYPALAIDSVRYDPQTAFDSDAKDIPYSFLAHALSTISETRSRIAILDTLTNTFRTIIHCHRNSLLPALYLLSNTLSSPYSSVELNIGPSTIFQAIQQVSGLSSSSLKKLYSSIGDPGDVAFAAKSNTRTLFPHPPLLVSFVYKSLLEIASCKGHGATKEKQKITEKLLVSAKGEEIRFLVRTLFQNLRVGAVRTSLLTALARCFVLTPSASHPDSAFFASKELLSAIQSKDNSSRPSKRKITTEVQRDELQTKFRSAESLLRQVFVRHPNYDHIVAALLQVGLDGLSDKVPLTVGIPVSPHLGSPIRSFQEIHERLNKTAFSAELKYDGQRAQIHAARQSNGQALVTIFSRHLEDMTSKYPDIAALTQLLFENHPHTQSFIIDSEIVAVDQATGSLKSFQFLSGRARKDVCLENVDIPVGVFAFDLLYLDGDILLEHSFRSRRALLRSRFPALIPENRLLARFRHVESCDSEEGQDQLLGFWEKAVSRHDSEGVMIKILDDEERVDGTQQQHYRKQLLSAQYDADKRTFSWMKLKKDYVSGLGDSLDLIPIGAWYGNGRKAQWWSPILLGIWNPDSGPVAVCKCMSGFTDVFYKTLSERYSLDNSQNCSKDRLWDCETGGFRPDVYFRPMEVWEIRMASVSLSPVSIAARDFTSSARGLSLRFPRFIKVRDDKSVEQANDALFLATVWRNQEADDGEADELIDVEIDSTGEKPEIDELSE